MKADPFLNPKPTSARQPYIASGNVILFYAVLIIPTVILVTQAGQISAEKFRSLENRNRSPLPNSVAWSGIIDGTVSLQGELKRFIAEAELWFTDRVGGRTLLLKLYGYLQSLQLVPRVSTLVEDRQILRNPKGQSHVAGALQYQRVKDSTDGQVVTGQSGWLFLGNDYSQVIDQYRGLKRVSESANYTGKFQSLKKACRETNARLLIALAPNKCSIYPEYLPKLCTPIEQDRLVPRFFSTADKLHIKSINLKNSLLLAKLKWGDRLYWKTDSHWTALGAYVAYAKIMSELVDWNIPTRKVHIDNWQTESSSDAVTINRGGDLTQLLIAGSAWNLSETFSIREPVHQLTGLSHQDASESATKIDGLSSGLTREATLASNQGFTVINPQLSEAATLVIFGDSFKDAMLPFFFQSFYKTHVYYTQPPRSFDETIKAHNPDVVIYELIERMAY